MSNNLDNKPMDSVFRVRAHQREWMDNIRERVTRGEPFAVCHADEVEEIFNVMDIPVMVINYWNSIIANKGLTQYYTEVLNKKGYDADTTGTLLLSAGFASALDNNPAVAPWGGLPKPTIIWVREAIQNGNFWSYGRKQSAVIFIRWIYAVAKLTGRSLKTGGKE